MIRSNRLNIVCILVVGFLSACSPYIYKNDVKKFAEGVDQATGAFNGLHDRVRKIYTDQELNLLATQGEPLRISEECTGVTTFDSQGNPGQLVADTRCLSMWSEWRSTDKHQRGDPPECPKNTSIAVREGRLAYYDFETLGKEESQRCELGVKTVDKKVDPRPLKEAEVLLVETPRLLQVLRAYGYSLAAIAGAEDRDALQSSVDEAKQAINGLAARVDKITGDDKQTLTVSVGLVGDLVGTALIAGLDYRRYKALQNVTAAADPSIQRAAMLLSQVSMPMVTIELQNAGAVYLDKVSVTNDRPKNQDWRAAYANARKARGAYLDLFNIGPSAVFQSMGDAHKELTKALQDSKRQRDALQESLQDFISKANSAYETFTQETAIEE